VKSLPLQAIFIRHQHNGIVFDKNDAFGLRSFGVHFSQYYFRQLTFFAALAGFKKQQRVCQYKETVNIVKLFCY
jgi:hypothetical protein